MAINSLTPQAFGFSPPAPAAFFPPQGPQLQGPSFFGPPPPMQLLSLLQQLIGAMTQLAQGWSGFGGQQQGPPQLTGGFGQFQAAGLQGPGVFGQFPGSQAPGVFGPQVPGPGAYGGGGGFGQSGLPFPSDPQEFSSYLQAQRIGGTLEGKTGIAQRDAIPGSRFGQVQDSTMWQASVARNYAYQFAAYANGHDALTPQGVAQGAQAFEKMSPDAQLFMQVASVFKGNLLGGPGFYNNPGLKELLLSRGLGDLANKPGVGETDVQSIGAVAAAISRGSLSLNEVINSGTIDNLGRYSQVIGYVRQGQFANDLRRYDTAAF